MPWGATGHNCLCFSQLGHGHHGGNVKTAADPSLSIHKWAQAGKTQDCKKNSTVKIASNKSSGLKLGTIHPWVLSLEWEGIPWR